MSTMMRTPPFSLYFPFSLSYHISPLSEPQKRKTRERDFYRFLHLAIKNATHVDGIGSMVSV